MDTIKARILQFATAIEAYLAFFTFRIFGSDEIYHRNKKITVDKIIELAAMYPELSMNWILTGRGRMIQSPNEIIIEALEKFSRKN